MQALSGPQPRRGRTAIVALVAMLVVLAAALVARPAGAAPSVVPQAKACPGFRVLHDDRIGAALFPAGTYTVNLQDASLTCKSSAELFARFLEDFDGNLPKPWQVEGEGAGKASFSRGELGGFSVELTAKGEGGANPNLGKLCPGTFTVNTTTVVGALRFTKGAFLVYLPAGSAINCKQAAILFTKFLAAGGPLPHPWKQINQTATFYKPANPTRTSFRIEPLNGSGSR